MKLSLRTKLLIPFLLLGIIPSVMVAFQAIQLSREMEKQALISFEDAADSIINKIDRNLFERYGDAQAFASNDIILDKTNWYKVGAEQNKIVEAANTYIRLYGLYPLSVIVDLEGKVIAVNDRNAAGEKINTEWIYEKNYSDALWFKETLAGKFLKGELADGTYVSDVFSDEELLKIYPNDSGLVMGFAAPIKDKAGMIIGVWYNRASFSLVEEIITQSYKDMAKKGIKSVSISVINPEGYLIADYDPSANNGRKEFNHNPDGLLKSNYVDMGVVAAKKLVNKESGYGVDLHPLKKTKQVVGFHAAEGALGYPGMGWGVIVSADENEAFADIYSLRNWLYLIIGGSGIVLIGASLFISYRISSIVSQGVQEIAVNAEQVFLAANEISQISQSIAEAASEQASSLEETSASLEEISSMTKQTTHNTQTSAEMSTQAKEFSGKSVKQMAQLKESMTKMSHIVKSIDEIAFQTNILALNAAVEAARAGEAGQGFAVVADEVRNLAQRSASSARETSEVIESSVKLTEEVAASLTEVSHQVNRVEGLMNEINSASKEQSQGIEQITSAVTDMDKVTQGNAASAEEMASAAQELNSQAENLRSATSTLQSNIVG
jgi:hypothetical protein